jgi:hypothetical protein
MVQDQRLWKWKSTEYHTQQAPGTQTVGDIPGHCHAEHQIFESSNSGMLPVNCLHVGNHFHVPLLTGTSKLTP